MATLIGLDIGATKTLGVAVAPDGAVLGEELQPTTSGVDGILSTAAAVVTALQARTGPAVGVGVGVPGLVEPASGTLEHAVNLGVDDSLPLRDLLAEALGVPVRVENDVNAAALGAAAVTDVDDLVYLSIGTGLAAGLVLEGQLRRGVRGAAGEVGHVPVDPAGELCRCGQRGCLETVASGRALSTGWPTADGPAAQALFASATAGDERAILVRDRFADGVAHAVRLLGLTYDPAVVMLGGGVAQLGEPLRLAVAGALVRQAATSPFLDSLDLSGRVRIVPRGYPVAAVGAALLGLSSTAEPV